MSDPFAAIEELRDAWETHAHFVARSFRTPVDAASEFGLHPNGQAFQECSRSRAETILRYLLRYDLAYGSDCMTDEQANAIIQSFMGMVPADAKFYTNGDWDRRSSFGERHVASGFSWVSATECTFDGGVLALGSNCAACIWFGDED